MNKLILKLENGLKDMEMLQDNWDSYGAKKISKIAIDRVKDCIIRHFTENEQEKTVSIAPTKDGGIILYAEYKFNENGKIDL